MPLSHPKRPAKISKNHCLYKSEPGGSKFLLEKQTKKTHSRFHNWDHNGPHCYGVHSWSPNDGEKIIWISHDFTIKTTDVCATFWCIYFVARNRRRPVGRPRLGPESDHKQQQSRQRNSPRCLQR